MVTNGSTITTTDYDGNYIYTNSALSQILQPEGYIVPNGSTYQYYFQYKDNLSSNRLTYSDFNGDGTISPSEIVEEDNYYPFGLKQQGYNNTHNGTGSKYKYNGKELQDDAVGNSALNWYDYGARFYDPALGRFTTIDPHANKYYSTSVFTYTMNNPIISVDPNGKDIVIFNQHAQETGRFPDNEQFITYVQNSKGNYVEAQMPGVIKGYENPKYQQLDYQIAATTAVMNEHLENLTDLPAASGHRYTANSKTTKLDVNLVKAQIMEESRMGTYNGILGTGKSDPMQVNNVQDWSKDKLSVGLTKGQKMTPEISINAGVKYLIMKGMKSDAGGNYLNWKGDNQALHNYNGHGNPNYVNDIMKFYKSIVPAKHNNYELQY